MIHLQPERRGGGVQGSPLLVDRVRVDWGRMPVKLVFSYGEVSEFPFVIVRLWSKGHCGIGEALAPCSEFLMRVLQGLPGADVRRLDALLPPEVFAVNQAGSDHSRILCEAVSMALYDLLGHASGLPLHALLGGAKQLTVPLMPCLFPRNAEQAGEGARRWGEVGYRFLKLKLVGDLAEDRARVEAVRSVWPRDRVLQGDANCGYKTLDAAQCALAELGRVGLDIFEDPLEGGVEDYALLTRRRGTADAKVMIDALSRRTNDLAAALRSDACDVVGIHPVQPGSLSRALQHAALAAAFGVHVIVGGTGYTCVGSAAYQHLAGVIGGPVGELGGYFDHGMPRLLVKKPLRMQDGCVCLTDAPGIGVALDLPTVEACRAAGVQVIHAPSPDWARNYPRWHLEPETGSPPESAGETECWPPAEFRNREGDYSAFAYPRAAWEPVWKNWLEQNPLPTLKIAECLQPRDGDCVVATGEQLHRFCRTRKVLHLFYAGFAANICIQFRDYGMRAMRDHTATKAKRRYML